MAYPKQRTSKANKNNSVEALLQQETTNVEIPNNSQETEMKNQVEQVEQVEQVAEVETAVELPAAPVVEVADNSPKEGDWIVCSSKLYASTSVEKLASIEGIEKLDKDIAVGILGKAWESIKDAVTLKFLDDTDDYLTCVKLLNRASLRIVQPLWNLEAEKMLLDKALLNAVPEEHLKLDKETNFHHSRGAQEGFICPSREERMNVPGCPTAMKVTVEPFISKHERKYIITVSSFGEVPTYFEAVYRITRDSDHTEEFINGQLQQVIGAACSSTYAYLTSTASQAA